MKKLFLLIIGTICVFACSSKDKDAIREVLKEGNSVVVDVRTPNQFDEGHVKNSINIPLATISDSASIAELKKYNNIVLVCNSGNQSNKAKTILEEKGFTNLHDGKGWSGLNKALYNE